MIFLKAIMALLFVLALIIFTMYLLKKYAPRIIKSNQLINANMHVERIGFIDHKRTLVAITHRNKQYIMILGDKDTLLDTLEI
jgi:hypothetical protein